MFNLIKQIFQKNKNAYIVVIENEKPVLVIQSFEEYQKIFGGNPEHKEADNSGKDNLGKAADNSADNSFDCSGLSPFGRKTYPAVGGALPKGAEQEDTPCAGAGEIHFGGGEEELESLNREIMNLQSSSEFGAEMPESGRREAGNAGVEDIPVM